MRLENRALVAAAPDAVFALLMDPERLVTCLPGATLTGRLEDAWTGAVSLKVGPISARYEGSVRFIEVDHSAQALRLSGRGTDPRGAGTTEAQLHLRVLPHAAGTELVVETDLLISGKLAQFGRGAIAAVSTRVLDQFAAELARVAAGDDVRPEPIATGPTPQAFSGATVQTWPGLDGVSGSRVWERITAMGLVGLGAGLGFLLGRAVERNARRRSP